jgi:hypothetical protein
LHGDTYHPATKRFLFVDIKSSIVVKEEILSVSKLSAGEVDRPDSPAFCHFPFSTQRVILSVGYQYSAVRGIFLSVDENVERSDGGVRSTIKTPSRAQISS